MAIRNAGNYMVWMLAALALILTVGVKNLPTQQNGARQTPASHPMVGGADVLTIARKPTSNGNSLEFLSVTVFPGRGMNIFQITANIPGKGKVPLLK